MITRFQTIYTDVYCQTTHTYTLGFVSEIGYIHQRQIKPCFWYRETYDHHAISGNLLRNYSPRSCLDRPIKDIVEKVHGLHVRNIELFDTLALVECWTLASHRVENNLMSLLFRVQQNRRRSSQQQIVQDRCLFYKETNKANIKFNLIEMQVETIHGLIKPSMNVFLFLLVTIDHYFTCTSRLKL